MQDRRQILKSGASALVCAGIASRAGAVPGGGAEDGALLDILAQIADKPAEAQLKALARFRFSTLSASAADELAVAREMAQRSVAIRAFGYGQAAGLSGGISPYVVSLRSGAWLKFTAGNPETGLAEAVRADSEQIRRDAQIGVVPPDFIVNHVSSRIDSAAARAATSELKSALFDQAAVLRSLQKRTEAGVWALPNGDAYYTQTLAQSASGTITPETAHTDAADRIAALNARLIPLLEKQGLTSDTVGARLHTLAQDTRYLYEDSDAGRTAAVADMNQWLAECRPAVTPVLSWLPKELVVKMTVTRNGWRDPPAYDGSRPGTYYVDLRTIRKRPRWSLKTVVHHELLPGHLLQAPLQDHAAPPQIRVRAATMAYTEGWACYAESLADEMGRYTADPLGEIGMLQSLLMRYARQFVDTGIHYKRWSRDKGLATLSDICGDMADPLETEIDRIIMQPGVTAGHAIGCIAIEQQRARAQKTLGRHFVLRDFHDVMLNRGPAPLAMLERLTDRYIAGRRKA